MKLTQDQIDKNTSFSLKKNIITNWQKGESQNLFNFLKEKFGLKNIIYLLT